MPIHGVTDRDSLRFLRGTHEIARLFKGGKQVPTKNGKFRAGPDLNYFRVEFGERFKHLEQTWVEMHGAEPRTIPNIFFPPDERADSVFTSWMEAWGGKGLIRRCDRVNQVRWFDDTQGRCANGRIPCLPSCDCVPVGRLKFIPLDFTQATGTPGYMTLVTHSWDDVQLLTNTLYIYESMYRSIAGIPFTLGREEREVSVPKMENNQPTGERINVKKWMLYLSVPGDFNRQMLSLAFTGELPTLAAPENSDVYEDTGYVPVDENGEPVLDDQQPTKGVEDEETVVNQSWDREYVFAETVSLFESKELQQDYIGKMVLNGNIKPEMLTAQVIATIVFARAMSKYQMSNQQVLEALSKFATGKVTKWGQWTRGVAVAWTAISHYASELQGAGQDVPF